MFDNQFRTLALLERSLLRLRPQRLLSNNAVFFTNYLIHNTCDVFYWWSEVSHDSHKNPSTVHFRRHYIFADINWAERVTGVNIHWAERATGTDINWAESDTRADFNWAVWATGADITCISVNVEEVWSSPALWLLQENNTHLRNADITLSHCLRRWLKVISALVQLVEAAGTSPPPPGCRWMAYFPCNPFTRPPTTSYIINLLTPTAVL